METDWDDPGRDTVANFPINTVLTDDEELVFPPNQSSQPRFSEEQEEQIAAFFEDHPLFYDMTSSHGIVWKRNEEGQSSTSIIVPRAR